jgi:SAM-dependent methyltransferase
LPVRDGAVAAVTACASLHYAPDPREAVREAARALRPGGVLVASLSPVHDTDEGARAGERVARRRTGMARYRHLSMSEVNAAFGGAGLALEIKEFRVPGRVGAVRRAKQVIGIDLAHFPTLVGRKPPL